MLSILIPVYNHDVRSFVNAVHQQASALNVPFEIHLLDDGSDNTFKEVNSTLKSQGHIFYEELPKNIGRAAIRNKLADDARGEYLIFLDCDSYPESNEFIENYTKSLPWKGVVYGGRCYKPSSPGDNYLLHWTYGTARECDSAVKRSNRPYRKFMTNNFLIDKTTFNSIRFDESITTYGHEDSLFGLELEKNNVPIKHIENALCHVGLDENKKFIAKSKEAIENLAALYKQGKVNNEVRLLRAYRMLKRLGVLKLITKRLIKKEATLLKNFSGNSVDLKAFDQWKLLQLIRVLDSEL